MPSGMHRGRAHRRVRFTPRVLGCTRKVPCRNGLRNPTTTDERSREEQTTTDERSREEQTTTDERSREEETTTANSPVTENGVPQPPTRYDERPAVPNSR